MGKHLKRLAAPRAWGIEKKRHKWAVAPRAGPHRKESSSPLLLAVRDMLKYANTSREAKRIITEGKILVDKKVRKDYKFPLGLMDVVEIPAAKERYVILFDKKGRLYLKKILKKEAKFKLRKIINKSIVKGGNIQLNLHDGRNYLVKVKDPEKPKEDIYKTKDTLVFDLAKNSIIEHIPYKKGNLAYITGGTHRGEVAKIEEMHTLRSPESNVVVLARDDKKFQTIDDYVFVIGEEKPVLSGVVE